MILRAELARSVESSQLLYSPTYGLESVWPSSVTLLGNLPSWPANNVNSSEPLAVGTGLPDSKNMPASVSSSSMRRPSEVMVISTWSFRSEEHTSELQSLRHLV